MKFLNKKFLVIYGVVIFVISVSSAFSLLNAPVHGREAAESFVIQKGGSVTSVARELKNAGLIRSKFLFITLVRLQKGTGSIKSGEYSIEKSSKTSDIINKLVRGEVVTLKFTVPEGLYIRQIADLLQKKGIVSADKFIAASSSRVLLEKYHIPFNSAEGFLFPDTYVVAKGLDAYRIVEIMIQRFFEELDRIHFNRYSNEDLKRIVIIASLIEREAKVDNERPLISAVFYNRLNKNKRLESCATVQYVLGKPKERLLFSDLKIESPYNTYLYTGLPPGPIANPGIKSIQAAISPADVDYLFFVSKKDGTHYFSSTYREHLDAIEKYKSNVIGHHIS